MGPPPPRSGGGGLVALALILLAVVVLVGGVIGVVVFLGGNDGPEPAPPIASRGVESPSSQPSESPASTVRPKVPGWQGVASVKHGLAYDVPKSWTVKSPTTIVGFEDENGKPLAGMSGAAGIQRGDCTLVRTGVSGGVAPDTSGAAKLGDLPSTAKFAAGRWAKAGYTPEGGPAPTVRLSSPVSVTLGGIRGYQVTADVTVNGRRGPCDPPKAILRALAFPSTQGDPVVFIAYADRGVSGEVADQDIAKAISSIRPLD